MAKTMTRRPFLLDRCCHPSHATHPDGEVENSPCGFPRAPSLFGLAPGGVCHAAPVAGRAVGSYPTLSPLPQLRGGLLSVALSLGSPPPAVGRHRVSLEPGLSSQAAFRHMRCAAARPAGTLYKGTRAQKRKQFQIRTANGVPGRSRLTAPKLPGSGIAHLLHHLGAIGGRNRVHPLRSMTGVVFQNCAAG